MGKRNYGVVVPVMMAGLLAAACGGGSAGSSGSVSTSQSSSTKTAAEILPEVQAALKAAKSVHMTGTVTDGPQKTGFNMSFYGKTGLSGSFTEGGGGFQMLAVGGKTYIKANAAFLKVARVPGAACTAICGKYIELPGSAAGQITGSLSLSSLSRQAFGKLPSASKDTSEHFVPATYHGESVLQFRQGKSVLDVAATGTPYPVLIQSAGDAITFSDWNSVPAPVAPPARKVLNIGQL